MAGFPARPEPAAGGGGRGRRTLLRVRPDGVLLPLRRGPDRRLRARAAADALRPAGDARRGGGRAGGRRLEGVGSRRAAGRPPAAGGILDLGAAFALARAPTSRLPLLSGNTLATAFVGLALYGRALWKERKPAYLYAAFAALFLVYFGTQEFFKDLFSAFEGTIGGALGYGKKLPLPFRGLNGLVLNVLLAGLAIVFRRRWKDDRLAMHCGYIGLPVALAACALSGLDPLAAVLTMGGYTIAFGVATWLFATPALAYLACLAFAGAAVAGSTYLGDLALGARSLALATVGLVLWVACRVLAIEKVRPPTACPSSTRRGRSRRWPCCSRRGRPGRLSSDVVDRLALWAAAACMC
ncbi:MAG: hypothetical protein WKF75_11230 [Singulisphaera sp.]